MRPVRRVGLSPRRCAWKPFSLAASFAVAAACSGDPEAPATIAIRWTHERPSRAAPPTPGPERRVIVLLEENTPQGGELVTLEEGNGRTVEGPFDGTPLSEHAPVIAGTTIVFTTKIGKVSALNLAGQTVFSKPDAGMLGTTQPI